MIELSVYGERQEGNMAYEKQPLISVVVPAYNIEEYLPRCIQSILAQTWTNLEVVLVDDGSTDGTGALCDELARGDERVRVFHKPNGGSSSARNLALSKVRGDYIGFSDSDDYLEPDMYEKLMRTALAYDAAIVQIGRDEIDEQGNVLPDICVPPTKMQQIDSEDFLRELLMHRGDCSFCTKLIRRDCLEGRGFPEGVLNEDFHLLVQMLSAGNGVVSLPGYGYHVFYRIGSNTRKADKENFSRVYRDCVDNADMVTELVREKYPALLSVALRFGVFQRLEYMLHIPISQMQADNVYYRGVVAWLRRNWLRSMANPILTAKNKMYHTLFALAPRGVRVVHSRVRLG